MNLTEVTSFLQNEPVALVILAAIAVILALFYLFPALLHLVPTNLVNEETKKTHRRLLFFGALFVVLSLLALGALFVPGVREKVAQFTGTKQKQSTAYLLNGVVKEIDKKEDTFTVQQAGLSLKYRVKVTNDTKILELGSKKPLKQENIKLGSTVRIVSDQVPTSKKVIVAQKISVYSEFPSIDSLPSLGGE